MGASRIQGITVEIGGDTTKLTAALKGVNGEIRTTQSQLRDVERLLKLDPGNTRSGQSPTGTRNWRYGYSFKTKEVQGGRAVAQPFRPVTDLQLQFCVHFFCFCRQAFPQEHGLAVGKMSGSDPMLRRKENVKKKCDIDLKKSDVE